MPSVHGGDVRLPLRHLSARVSPTTRNKTDSLVGPKLAKPLRLEHRQVQIQRRIHTLLLFPITDQLGHLAEKLGIMAARVDPETQDGARAALGGDVHEMQFGFTAVALDAVISGRVDVPARHVDRLVVALVFLERKVRKTGKVALRMGERHRRAVTPVVKLSGNISIVSGHIPRHMSQGKSLIEPERYRRLLCAILAQYVFLGQAAPIVRGFVRPGHVALGALLQRAGVVVVLGASERERGEERGEEGFGEHDL